MRSPTNSMKKIRTKLLCRRRPVSFMFVFKRLSKEFDLKSSKAAKIFFIKLMGDLITILLIMWSSCAVVIRVFQSFSYRYRSHPVDTLQSLGTLLFYYTSFEQLFVVQIKFCPCKATIRACLAIFLPILDPQKITQL